MPAVRERTTRHRPIADAMASNNTIYLLHTVACAFSRAHHLTRSEFNAHDRRFQVLRYVSTCPSRFDALPESEMVKEIDRYVASRA